MIISDLSKYVFLLGGHDLEMLEILKILRKKGFQYVDKNLKWGARLSSYADCFDHKNIFVGIELTKDIKPPKHYLEIDHHNENVGKESSLEQIAELTKTKLNRRQTLIAANDKGYIPAMVKLGASGQEIKRIRRADRKAQGVTLKDERLAEKSIKENLSVIGNITVVCSYTDFFSTIADRLYPCNKLLIFNENNITYFGEGVKKLSEFYYDLVLKNIAWFGGGENGFFGILSQYSNPDEIIKIITKNKKNE
ncbi:MAG TPA: hypothetical protein PLS26_11860 [Bacteroidales bacterium]|nr:hypothetical protein [Bacteroidales bacterium]